MVTAEIEILMAVYNGADYIEDQLQSILEQSYPHFQITIRDDCSHDNTVPLIKTYCQRYPDKIKLIEGRDNFGALGNFATLVSLAKGDYIMFSDGDDCWLPTKIEETFALMQKNEAHYGKETPLLIHTDLTIVDRQLKTLHPSFWNYSKLNPHSANHLNRLLAHNVVTGCTMLINKPLLQLASPIPKEAIMHDWWMTLVASTFGKIDYLPKSTLLYRQHGHNHTGAKNWQSYKTYLEYAKKASSFAGRKALRKQLLRTYQQADKFLSRYHPLLDPLKKELVQNYAHMSQTRPLQKRKWFLKHRYFKNTLAKNLGMFLLM